jgi:putative tryptophan/tyrosine transport system substrate-binding protein
LIVAGSGGIAIELRRISRIVPIVFPTANDPVGAGLVESVERPGGNAIGFSGFEIGETENFLELLKQIASGVTRVAVIRNPARRGGNWYSRTSFKETLKETHHLVRRHAG